MEAPKTPPISDLLQGVGFDIVDSMEIESREEVITVTFSQAENIYIGFAFSSTSSCKEGKSKRKGKKNVWKFP